MHKWSVWYDSPYNKYPYIHPKKQERECESCHQKETRALPSLEERLFLYHKQGANIEAVLNRLMSEHGKMRYQYCVKRLVEETLSGRR